MHNAWVERNSSQISAGHGSREGPVEERPKAEYGRCVAMSMTWLEEREAI